MKRFAALLAGVLLAQPVAAADGPPSPREDALARHVIAEFGACAADRRPESAADYVTNPGVRLDEDEWERLVDIRCMREHPGVLRMDPYGFRGALAQQLIVKRLGSQPLGDLAAVPPLAWPEPSAPDLDRAASEDRDKLQAAFRLETLQDYVSRFAECIVRRDAAGVRRLFDTEADSLGEREAIAAITPAIAGCVPAGEQVRIDRNGLRAGLATSYFRLAHALGVTVAGAQS